MYCNHYGELWYTLQIWKLTITFHLSKWCSCTWTIFNTQTQFKKETKIKNTFQTAHFGCINTAAVISFRNIWLSDKQVQVKEHKSGHISLDFYYQIVVFEGGRPIFTGPSRQNRGRISITSQSKHCETLLTPQQHGQQLVPFVVVSTTHSSVTNDWPVNVVVSAFSFLTICLRINKLNHETHSKKRRIL